MPDPRSIFVHCVFFLSGIAGIGYQMVWVRAFSTGLGHEGPSMLAVVAGFFGGLALGAWLLDGVVSRARAPGRAYAILEAIIALWGVATIWLIPLAGEFAASRMGLSPTPMRQWVIAFLTPMATLLPATMAMGATLPAIDRLVERLRLDLEARRAAARGARGGRAASDEVRGKPVVGGLYAVNTLGAVAGTLLVTFILVPRLGIRWTIVALAACNILCALAMWRRYLGIGQGAGVVAADIAPEAAPSKVDVAQLASERLAHLVPRATEAPLSRGRIYLTLLLTGFLGIGYEVLGVLAIGQALQDTVYTFAAALGVYLLGTAIGGSLYQVLLRRFPARTTLVHLFQGLATACLLGIVAISQAHAINQQAGRLLGTTLAGSVGAEAMVAASVFLLPTIFMGAIFSLLAQNARGEHRGIGIALGINTFGGFLAAPVLGVGLLPVLGAKWALAVAGGAYLLLMPRTTKGRLMPAVAVVAGLCVLPFVSMRLVEAPRGGRVVLLNEGVMGAVAVVTDHQGDRFLKINNEFQMGGTAPTFAEKRQAMIPLLLHPSPHTALFLGIGTGVTLGAGAIDSSIHCDGVELVPGVVAALAKFEPENLSPGKRPNVRIHTADARRFVRTVPAEYDVIVADLFHPARDGAASLYTLEHFRAVRSRLAPGGLFCQWLPLYQLDTPTFLTIARTFLKVFEPEGVRVCMAHFNSSTPMIGLVGWFAPTPIDPGALERRIGDPALKDEMPLMAIERPLDVLGCLVTTGTDLMRLVGSGDINTDNRPVVMFTAPRLAYDDREPPGARLERLLSGVRTDGAALLGVDEPQGSGGLAQQLGPYLKARDLFIKAASLEAALAARLPPARREAGGLTPPVVAVYLESVRAGSEFRASYVRLLAGAESLAPGDPEGARRILSGLIEADSTRPDAAALLNRLSAVDQPK